MLRSTFLVVTSWYCRPVRVDRRPSTALNDQFTELRPTAFVVIVVRLVVGGSLLWVSKAC
jgi:hypothetical protein